MASSEPDFSRAAHTLVVSDIHLADAEPPHPKNPLWKRFKRPKHFIDKSFRAFLEYARATWPGPLELVLNGDIFDFDSVMTVPNDLKLHVGWLERKRGLNSEEMKSRFKLKAILRDHPVWLEAVREFVAAGNRAVFVIGNHDMELHWPSAREDIVRALELPEALRGNVRFCEWFYVSNHDTLIEHGNQYDAYCLCANPINPLIKMRGKPIVRLPFGNLAGKYMLNGMGLMNPHADSSYIKSTAWEYMAFYYRYMMRTQPGLLWTWLWSAFVTLIYSVQEGLMPSLTDPMTIGARVDDIARRSNVQPAVVWSLRELHVHPAIYNPLKILRELWLDRALLLALIVFGSLQLIAFLNIIVTVSLWWFVIPIVLFTPLFVFYSRSVQSDVEKTQKAAFLMAPLSARITGLRRVVQGHTHLERHTQVAGVEYLNTGTWSPAFRDVECTQPYGRKCFAHIAPGMSSRVAELFEWKDDRAERIAFESVGEVKK